MRYILHWKRQMPDDAFLTGGRTLSRAPLGTRETLAVAVLCVAHPRVGREAQHGSFARPVLISHHSIQCHAFGSIMSAEDICNHPPKDWSAWLV